LLKIGVTGGIGSGKSVVCKVFESLGIPVFRADDAARYLMEHDAALKAGIAALLGAEVYVAGALDRKRISDIVFRDPRKLQQLNALVHPVTIRYGKEWINTQKSLYIIKEAAIFFESGSNKEMDVMIGVSCPLETRIARVMARGGQSREKVLEIIAKQMDQDEKMKLCDHVVINDDITPVIPQVVALHDRFIKKER
jgi:dephospho-CoA kinase